MQKKRKKAGFTLGEVLIVIAIIGVLSAIAFVGVVNYLRSLTKLEYDGYAKEIFIEAQNHLSMAKSQGYLGSNEFGNSERTVGATGAEKDVYYYFVTDEDRNTVMNKKRSVLDLMLPFGSIDETIRGGGCYVIRYHKTTGEVLDVYYWSESGRYPYDRDSYQGHPNDYVADYNAFRDASAEDTAAELLKNFGSKKAVIGYFGGEAARNLPEGEENGKPKLTLTNAEKLQVTVKATDAPDLKLILNGLTSKASQMISLKKNGSPDTGKDYISYDADKEEYTVILDEITSDEGHHFHDLFCVTGIADKNRFIPGENITIQAVASSSRSLSNVAYSPKRTTNSLFASLNRGSVSITNIRHLENLNTRVSNLEFAGGHKNPVEISKAVQKADLSWSKFNHVIEGDADYIYAYRGLRTDPSRKLTTAANTYYPVTPSYISSYDGGRHSIFDIRVDHNDSSMNEDEKGSGLFGTLSNRTVSNLRLIDFEVNGNSDTGALAGVIRSSKVTNVIAFNSRNDKPLEKQITGGGNAGGLIGKAEILESSSEPAKILKSAAALTVSSSGTDAGGLIGNAWGAVVTASYSGGHTGMGSYAQNKKNDQIVYNVTGVRNAGGLIGGAVGGTIIDSYSTCSVSVSDGNPAGGLVGAAQGVSFERCYATGLIEIPRDRNDLPIYTNRGAFAGTLTGSVTACRYFEIVNEVLNDRKLEYLGPVGNQTNPYPGISVLDAMTGGYYVTGNGAASGDWKSAVAYDPTLVGSYQGRYNMETVRQLQPATWTEEGMVETGDFVLVHYGDWPAPEVRVKND